MAIMTTINDDNLAFYNRLTTLASDRDAELPRYSAMGSGPVNDDSDPDHDAQYEHMTAMSGWCGIDMQDDYLLALRQRKADWTKAESSRKLEMGQQSVAQHVYI